MIVKTLVENDSVGKSLGHEHGLSLYFDTERHRILFDMGAGSLFAENAKKMNVDLEIVDVAVISHGHSDHGGGLDTFLKINSDARIYMNRRAFGGYYVRKPGEAEHYVGLDSNLLPNGRFVFVDEHLAVDGELEFFSGVSGEKWRPSANGTLFAKKGDFFEQDDFSHEQNMILTEKDKKILVAGCAHNGIVNILERFRDTRGFLPTHVIGGFHLFNPSTGESENEETIAGIAGYLMGTGAKFFTGHCTGSGPFEQLKGLMGDRIERIRAGSVLEF